MEIESKHIHVVRYDEVPSTNLIALEFAEQGAPDGTVIRTLQQSGGRGRLGRSFFSPPGGLYFSLILRPKIFFRNMSLLTLAAGVASSRVIEEASGVTVRLKWPNDLYLAEKKLGGILTEAAPYSYRTGSIPFLVIGIGLNINTRIELFQPPLQNNITSLFSLQQREYDLDQLMSDISVRLRRYVADPELLDKEVLASWRKRDYLFGRKITWRMDADNSMAGIGAGLLEDGQYALKTAEGKILPILGGELSFKKSDSKVE